MTTFSSGWEERSNSMAGAVNVHLLSDSTGETVGSVGRAALAQFRNNDVEFCSYNLIRSVRQLERVCQQISQAPGPVIFTLVRKDMRQAIRAFCEAENLPCISVLGNAITQLSAYLGEPTAAEPGRQHELNDNYFSRVEAINFALSHDDGQSHWNLEAADIVIVGPSRTSKSPTCIYLANKGYRAANVPFVLHCDLPQTLFQLTSPLIVGLTIDTERLYQIRESRLKTLGSAETQDYADREVIAEEVLAAKRLFSKQRWPTLDVTRRSVEETAAQIIERYKQARV